MEGDSFGFRGNHRATRHYSLHGNNHYAELTGRTFGTVWQKRLALGIDQPALKFRKRTPAEDKLVGTASDAQVARQLGRTETAVKSRRAILDRRQASRETKPIFSDPKPCPAALTALGVAPQWIRYIARRSGSGCWTGAW